MVVTVIDKGLDKYKRRSNSRVYSFTSFS